MRNVTLTISWITISLGCKITTTKLYILNTNTIYKFYIYTANTIFMHKQLF